MTLDEVRAVVDEAHRRNLPVVAHAHRPEEIRRGIAAGVDNFEHTGLAAAPEYPEDIITLIRERAANMAAGPLFWTPTIEGLFNYEYVRDNPEHIDDTAWHEGLPKDIVDDIRKSVEHPERLDYFRATPSRRPTLARKFQQLREAGVTLLIGTDSGIPMKFHSGSTWRELDAWVNLLGVDADDDDPRGDVLAGRGDAEGARGRHHQPRQIRRHHRGEGRRAALHRVAAASGYRDEARRAGEVARHVNARVSRYRALPARADARESWGSGSSGVRLASPFLLRSIDPPLDALIGRKVSRLRRLGKRSRVGHSATSSLRSFT